MFHAERCLLFIERCLNCSELWYVLRGHSTTASKTIAAISNTTINMSIILSLLIIFLLLLMFLSISVVEFWCKLLQVSPKKFFF